MLTLATQSDVPLCSMHKPVFQAGSARLEGRLMLPEHARGVVLIGLRLDSGVDGSTCEAVATALNQIGLGTLSLPLLTEREEWDSSHGFDEELLTQRLTIVGYAIQRRDLLHGLPLAFVCEDMELAAAFTAERSFGANLRAIVALNGVANHISSQLDQMRTPTLLIVGEHDWDTADRNKMIFDRLKCRKSLYVVDDVDRGLDGPDASQEIAASVSTWLDSFF